MARDEGPREDLMREAVALVRRLELAVDGEPAPVVVGFRRDGSASFYFGEDPVIQFNAAGELRRSYLGGRLLKSEKGRLSVLTRVRTATETQLLRRDLPAEEATRMLHEIENRLRHLRHSLEQGRGQALREEPPHAGLLGQVRDWLAALPAPLAVAASPRSG